MFMFGSVAQERTPYWVMRLEAGVNLVMNYGHSNASLWRSELKLKLAEVGPGVTVADVILRMRV